MEHNIKKRNEERKKQMIKLEEFVLKENNCDEDSMKSIVEETPSNLVSMIRNDELTAVKVLRAFQYKALQVTKKINCVTEFIPEAEKWAEERDRIALEDRKPLHGLPVSIKECIDVQGMDSTIGLAKHLYNPASKHSLIVQILIDNGAVPFCKTNVPQSLMSFCCSNPIYGKTLNPHDETRTPGGSSGGECALIAAGGSVVGIGNDVAGSCRMPANACGCCGIKFTSTRITGTGLRGINNCVAGILNSMGVLGRDADITALVARTLISAQDSNMKDASIVPVPWNDKLFTSENRLTIGYFDDADFFPCTPGVKRAVQEAKKTLETLGHRVIPFSMMDSEEISKESYKILTADEGKNLAIAIENETVDESLTWRLNDSNIVAKLTEDNCHDVFKFGRSLVKLKSNVQEINDRMDTSGIDLLLSPVHALPAPQHFVPAPLACNFFYTVFGNYCDFASGTVPITFESEEDQNLLNDYPEDDSALKLAKEATRGAVGMPIGVLLSGRCFQEELVLRAMQELQRATNNKA